jgi:hypothetical protein
MSSVLASDNFSPVWPGPSLLVPITADCLLVGNPDRSSTWAQTGTNYQNLVLRLTPDSPTPFVSKSTGDAPPAGAHIIWTLPYSLRRGQQQQQGANRGSVEFPAAPNRWIILRMQYAGGNQPTLTAGVVQSDLLTPLGGQTNPFNQYPDPTDTTNPVKRIGGYVSLSNWKGPAGPPQAFVKAVGPGDVSWAVAYDNIRNVFAFYDQLPEQKGVYTYCIIGWYATPAHDPLFQLPTSSALDWKTAVEQQFQWSVGKTLQDVQAAQSAWQAWQKSRGLGGSAPDPNLPPQLLQAIKNWQTWQTAHGLTSTPPPFPTQLLCHGSITNVVWNGSGATYGTGAPITDKQGNTQYPSVSIGNTATEAIAAWFADYVVRQLQHGNPSRIPEIERAIEAFQKNILLELEKDLAGAESLLHKARFGTAFGGKEWIVARPEAAGDKPGKYSGQQTVPLEAAPTQTLTNLNAKQADYDHASALLYSQRLELFMLYYKSKTLPRGSDAKIKAQLDKALAVMTGAVQSTQNALTLLEDSINGLRTQLTTQLGKDFTLQSVDRPSYYAPSDPVVMVAGLKQDTKFAAPGTYSDEETLFTRFTGQTVTGIGVDYSVGGSTILDVSDLLTRVTLPQGSAIPKEVHDLWLETIFVDPSSSTLLAEIFFKKTNTTPGPNDIPNLAKLIAAQQTAIYNNPEALGVDEKTLGKTAKLQGVPPSRTALELRLQQPWTPIYMDWKVKWFPSYKEGGSLSDWTLDEIDYEWKGQNPPQPSTSITFTGRTVLNPKIAQDISDRLSLFRDDPDYSQLPVDVRNSLTDLANEIGKFDIMTQSLGGFTEQLATQLMNINKTPDNAEIASLLGDAPVSFRPVAGDARSGVTLPYFPIRAGHFQVIDLWVVDSFGQILRGKDPNLGSDAPLPKLLRAESVTTPGTDYTTYVQLPPRVTQPARVDLLWLQANNDDIRSNSSDLTSPICGWVMPNHLDDSLMVFSATGENLGAAIKVQTDKSAVNPKGTGLRWDAAPGTVVPLGARPNLPNAHLQGFVNGLLQRGLQTGGAALTELLQSIDASLWTISPFGQQEGNLSVLLGRPLAVVRAELSLNLYGLPYYNQSWKLTGSYYVKDGQYNPTLPPFASVKFKLRVGDTGFKDNGVLGYFLNDDYSTFYAVYGSGGQTAQLYEALKQPLLRSLSLLQTLTFDAPLASSNYVERDHLIELPADGTKAYLTLLIDPRKVIPVITGSLPANTLALAPGPATQALNNMKATFRVGPVLTEPSKIRMPIPAEIKGNWAWLARTDVTNWGGETPIEAQDPIARLEASPLTLSEGWLTLSGAESNPKPNP